MLPELKQREIVQRYMIVDDAQERLSLVVDRARRQPAFSAEERSGENRVIGCSSHVWIAASVVDGLCHFRVDAESGLIKGLASVICEVYEGSTPQEAAAFDCQALEALHLTDHLSPTRRHGLQAVVRTIRERVAALASPP